MPQKTQPKEKGLALPELLSGTLQKRYKRFLADIQLDTGETIVAHCPNSGSMQACSQPGRPVWVSQSDNPKRKLQYTWELIEMPTSLVGVNTLLPNRLVFDAIHHKQVPGFCDYPEQKREVSVAGGSRLDIMLQRLGTPPCYIEIKNCTLVDKGVAEFPDAVTKRGRKHLETLRHLVSEGNRSIAFFLIQRMDARVFRPADQIDPEFGNALRCAVEGGVEMMVYDVTLSQTRIAL
ncbi:MAG: DNA/RNA nuclease SfsA, partial [Deltaproteobacteria bacterium]|nr:DNA/RNA nuclease SfsA [Deltaproteobacteria bacterium]